MLEGSLLREKDYLKIWLFVSLSLTWCIVSSPPFFHFNNLLFPPAGHGEKTGTNLYAALQRVNEMISFFKANRATNKFNETQNIIIIETDGKKTDKQLKQLINSSCCYTMFNYVKF